MWLTGRENPSLHYPPPPHPPSFFSDQSYLSEENPLTPPQFFATGGGGEREKEDRVRPSPAERRVPLTYPGYDPRQQSDGYPSQTLGALSKGPVVRESLRGVSTTNSGSFTAIARSVQAAGANSTIIEVRTDGVIDVAHSPLA